MIETWLPFYLDATYEVSSLGRVKNTKTGKLLAGTVREDGYTQVAFGRGPGRLLLLHRVILLTFVGPCPPGEMGLHADDVRSNNVLSNLRWGTSQHNAEDRVRNNRARGRDAAAAKLTREQVLDVCRRLDADERYGGISKATGLPSASITRINVGTDWGWLTGRTSANARCPTHKNHARKLTKATVLTIAERISRGDLLNAIAADADVRPQTILQIKQGSIWGHVTQFERRS